MGNFINNGKDPKEEQQPLGDTKVYFWVAVGACAVGALLLGLAFIPQVGQYGVFSSMLCQLVCITFLNVQKKYKYFTACKILRVLSYVLLLAGAAIIGGAAVISSQQPTK